MTLQSLQLFTLIVSVVSLSLVHYTAAVDQTLEEKTFGQDVVDAVVDKIWRSAIFREDYTFLKRLAYVQSKYGSWNETFRPNFHGGIWELTERRFDLTKMVTNNPVLAGYHGNISSIFNIAWANTTWQDLLKPLYSGLATRLFLATLEHQGTTPIPQTLKAQAKYWNDNYNNYDDKNATFFEEEIKESENGTGCDGKMDLLVVLDESASINQADPTNFDKALGFVANLLGRYSLQNVREGFITFSSKRLLVHEAVREHFPIENNLTAAEIDRMVTNTTYAGQNTHTSLALKYAAELFNKTSIRPGVPRVMTLFTDGESNDGHGVSNARLLEEIGVVSFAIGIAAYKMPELLEIAYNDNSHVFTLDDFDGLTEFFTRLNSETCAVPQEPELEQTTFDSLKKNEKRTYIFKGPEDGITVFLDTSQGKIVGYYSYSYSKPSSALHDGVLRNGEYSYIPPRPESYPSQVFRPRSTFSVYLVIEGLEERNNYTVRADSGGLVPSTTEAVSTTSAASSLTCIDDRQDFEDQGWATSLNVMLRYAQTVSELPADLQGLSQVDNQTRGILYFSGLDQTESAVLKGRADSSASTYVYVKYYGHFTTSSDHRMYVYPPMDNSQGPLHFLKGTSNFQWGQTIVRMDLGQNQQLEIGVLYLDAEEYFLVDKIIVLDEFLDGDFDAVQAKCSGPVDPPPEAENCEENGPGFIRGKDCDTFHVCLYAAEGLFGNLMFKCPSEQVWCQQRGRCEHAQDCPCSTL